MGNLFAASGLGDEKPHRRDVELVRSFMGRRPTERQSENLEAVTVHNIAVTSALRAKT